MSIVRMIFFKKFPIFSESVFIDYIAVISAECYCTKAFFLCLYFFGVCGIYCFLNCKSLSFYLESN